MINKETLQFFETLFGNEHINFRCIKSGQRPIDANGYFNENIIQKLKQVNDQDYEIYFVVNSGGYKNEQITKINAVFIDLDCGRNEKKEYYPLEYVKNYKQAKLKELNQFKFRPSYIIDTRNGFHVYWLVHSNTTIDQFLECEEQLIKYFDADNQVKNPARLMRVPGFLWRKDINNKYLARIIANDDVRHDAKEIIACLPKFEDASKPRINSNGKLIKPKIKSTNSIDFIKRLDVEGLKQKLMLGENVPTIENNNKFYSIVGTKTPSKIFAHNRQEVYDILKMINLHDFLGINDTMFNCLFHVDNNPSANIIYNEETGHYLYKCFSSQCHGQAYTIISVVEKLARCNKPKAINFLREVYDIELVETEWQKETKELLQSNIDYLLSGNLEIEYPLLYKAIRNYIPLLVTLHNVAINNVYDENLSDEQKIIFFASIRYIATLMDYADAKRLGNRINLFTFVDLLCKLSNEEIPLNLLKRAKHEAAKKKQKETVNFYAIPGYTVELLQQAEKLTKLFKDNSGTMRGWSRELLVRSFGDEVANKVYPKLKGNKLNVDIDKFADEFKSILNAMVVGKGYGTEKECLDYMKGRFSINQTLSKKVLQQCLNELGFKRIRCNKEIKKHYRVAETGYPFIVVSMG